MTTSRFSIADRLAHAQLALDNAGADPDIAAALAAYGYAADQLRQGAALRDQARTLAQRQRSAYGGLLAAGAALAAARPSSK